MEKAKVGVVMGSDSDLPVMSEAAKVFERFQVACELIVSSAHRIPEDTASYARRARDEGKEVLIAGAGGAAHLPGVIAALTVLPVIGVPIKTESLGGVDSLYSIVQMPRGVPVATVAINGAHNAALLALQIMALKDGSLCQVLEDYRAELAAGVREKNRNLQEMGYRRYLEGGQ